MVNINKSYVVPCREQRNEMEAEKVHSVEISAFNCFFFVHLYFMDERSS